MKTRRGSTVRATIAESLHSADESQVVATKGAPCRNRTYNLMIKSQIRASHLTRTEGVYLGFQATNDVELVPTAEPNRARRFPTISPE